MPSSSRLIDSAELRNQLIEAVRQGVPLPTAWRAAGLSGATYENWSAAAHTGHWRDLERSRVSPKHLAIIQQFVADIDAARAEHEAVLVHQITTAALEAVGSRSPDWKAGAWYLEHAPHTRARYFRHQESVLTTITPSSPEDQHVVTLSETDLLTLTDPEWRELLPPPPDIDPSV